MFLPLVFRTDNINTLVIGGGKVAYRKVKDLNAAGAELMVISPRCHPGLETFIIEKDIDWCKRKFRNGDTDGYSLVIVATDDDKVNQKVSTEAKNSGIPINVVDKPELSTVYFPATVRKDSLLISVSTEGNAPFFAREMKKKISEWVEDGEWELKAKWA
ncbi:MAG: bifunctional precorrin-2 dehydrogenase/sirohydrochlorin ferrochelatase, partial [Candidatus Electryonea clarkiae]|nr:bifunctional precorrin-2 dehydrogenase/sirohydrochlorin ferrochelatase [Candidatus Electryonea clarkiae]